MTPMQIDSLKTTTRFLGGAKLRSLAGKFQPNGLRAIRSTAIALKVPKAGSKLFLVGGNGKSASTWHCAEVEHLESESPDLEKLKAALEDHVERIMTSAERGQNGLNPVAELTVADVVLDDTRKLVFLNLTSNETDIDEHGLVAVFANAAWRLEDGGYVSSYVQDAAIPEIGSDLTPVSIVGRWIFDEQATVEMLKKKGGPDRWINESIAHSRGMEWIITESKLVQIHPVHSRDYRLLSCEIRKNVCQITVDTIAMKFPEVWKMRIKGDRLFGGCVMKRAE